MNDKSNHADKYIDDTYEMNLGTAQTIDTTNEIETCEIETSPHSTDEQVRRCGLLRALKEEGLEPSPEILLAIDRMEEILKYWEDILNSNGDRQHYHLSCNVELVKDGRGHSNGDKGHEGTRFSKCSVGKNS
jgi:hypothetical protein